MKNNELIHKLITSPQSQEDIGWNKAIITLLKEITPLENPKMDILRRHLISYEHFSQQQLEDLCSILDRKNKLEAVKFIKDITGHGLRESKESVDVIFTYYFP